MNPVYIRRFLEDISEMENKSQPLQCRIVSREDLHGTPFQEALNRHEIDLYAGNFSKKQREALERNYAVAEFSHPQIVVVAEVAASVAMDI